MPGKADSRYCSHKEAKKLDNMEETFRNEVQALLAALAQKMDSNFTHLINIMKARPREQLHEEMQMATAIEHDLHHSRSQSPLSGMEYTLCPLELTETKFMKQQEASLCCQRGEVLGGAPTSGALETGRVYEKKLSLAGVDAAGHLTRCSEIPGVPVMTGGLGLHEGPSLEAMEKMSKVGKIVLPNQQDKRFYEKKYQVFLKLFEHQREYKTIMESV